jgi:hypothetical protein
MGQRVYFCNDRDTAILRKTVDQRRIDPCEMLRLVAGCEQQNVIDGSQMA